MIDTNRFDLDSLGYTGKIQPKGPHPLGDSALEKPEPIKKPEKISTELISRTPVQSSVKERGPSMDPRIKVASGFGSGVVERQKISSIPLDPKVGQVASPRLASGDEIYYTSDMQKIQDYLSQKITLTPEEKERLDFSGDGQVKVTDAMLVAQYLKGLRNLWGEEQPGDVDGNGIIEQNDANMIADHLVKNTTLTPEQLARADASGEGKVDISDAMFIAQGLLGLRNVSGRRLGGDVDGNGILDPNDSKMIQDYLSQQIELTSEQLARANVTGEGELSIVDAMKVAQILYAAENAPEWDYSDRSPHPIPDGFTSPAISSPFSSSPLATSPLAISPALTRVLGSSSIQVEATKPIQGTSTLGVSPQFGKWYTQEDAQKIKEYRAGIIELTPQEKMRLSVLHGGYDLSASDGMRISQYLEGVVPRGPSGYAASDAWLVAKHMAGLIDLPPVLQEQFDANKDGRLSTSDAMTIAQAIAAETVPEPEVPASAPVLSSPLMSAPTLSSPLSRLGSVAPGITRLASTSPGVSEPTLDSKPGPPDRIVGGGGWAELKNYKTGERGWIQYGIGTQYKYGGEEWDEKYKDWVVGKSGRELEPPKGANLLSSGYPTSSSRPAIAIKPVPEHLEVGEVSLGSMKILPKSGPIQVEKKKVSSVDPRIASSIKSEPAFAAPYSASGQEGQDLADRMAEVNRRWEGTPEDKKWAVDSYAGVLKDWFETKINTAEHLGEPKIKSMYLNWLGTVSDWCLTDAKDYDGANALQGIAQSYFKDATGKFSGDMLKASSDWITAVLDAPLKGDARYQEMQKQQKENAMKSYGLVVSDWMRNAKETMQPDMAERVIKSYVEDAKEWMDGYPELDTQQTKDYIDYAVSKYTPQSESFGVKPVPISLPDLRSTRDTRYLPTSSPVSKPGKPGIVRLATPDKQVEKPLLSPIIPKPAPPDNTGWVWGKEKSDWIRPTGAVFMPVEPLKPSSIGGADFGSYKKPSDLVRMAQPRSMAMVQPTLSPVAQPRSTLSPMAMAQPSAISSLIPRSQPRSTISPISQSSLSPMARSQPSHMAVAQPTLGPMSQPRSTLGSRGFGQSGGFVSPIHVGGLGGPGGEVLDSPQILSKMDTRIRERVSIPEGLGKKRVEWAESYNEAPKAYMAPEVTPTGPVTLKGLFTSTGPVTLPTPEPLSLSGGPRGLDGPGGFGGPGGGVLDESLGFENNQMSLSNVSMQSTPGLVGFGVHPFLRKGAKGPFRRRAPRSSLNFIRLSRRKMV